MKYQMMKRKVLMAISATILCTSCALTPMVAFAADSDSSDDIEAQIQEQQHLLDQLNAKKRNATENQLKSQMKDIEEQIDDLKKQKNYDAQGAIDALSAQLAKIQEQLDEQAKTQNLLNETLEKLNKLESRAYSQETTGGNGSINRLVNPAPRGNLSYTQDARNAQNNSTMVFSYAPDQLYKIYCRTGYLTDISLHEGETVKFVGGGDTSAWAINSTTVGKTPHIYIKPVTQTSTTNIIITTDKRSYQLIVCTSDWYNPMVRWTYGAEEAEMDFKRQQSDEKNITASANAVSVDDLNFNYRVKTKGSASKPEMVFDDGEKTIIKFGKKMDKMPALFIRERGHKTLSLTNYKMKDGAYILDRLIDYAELRYNENDIVTIERNR